MKSRQDISKQSLKAGATAAKWKQPTAVVNTDKLQKQKDIDLKLDENLAAQLEAMTKLILSEQIKKVRTRALPSSHC
jgi:hypothetical protein